MGFFAVIFLTKDTEQHKIGSVRTCGYWHQGIFNQSFVSDPSRTRILEITESDFHEVNACGFGGMYDHYVDLTDDDNPVLRRIEDDNGSS